MFEDGDAYQRFMGRWSDRVAASFVADLHVPDECWWLDVGCGSGALLAAVLHARRPARLTGLDPSPAQLALARRRLATTSEVSPELVLGSADAVPLADGVVDVAVTGLVLNFCPDPGSALAELVRVTRPGGTVAGYVWDYRHPDFFLRRYWDAADLEGVLGNADERHRWPVCTDDGMAALLAVHPGAVQGAITIETAFASHEELWTGYTLGIGPVGAHLAGLDGHRRARLQDRLRDVVDDAGGPAALTARALTFSIPVP
ncbi:class I SAM-dependent methyltransferase [Euzebya rosea]|uniref:class I SAM-dependent methyltransferase n=1 Tax=Euzebya rosea TaxID=2052804 RepID=UPI000D3EDD0B|nr:class I SAM-dependent methyltransferase [Euzebya rosea]